jgi:predicted nicotinamide N-methyase
MADQPTALRLALMFDGHRANVLKQRIEKLETVNQELLEALKRIKQTGVFVGAIAQEMMDAAIAKAEGQA